MSPKKMSAQPRRTHPEPPDTEPKRPVATRRRGATLEHALLDAAWQELQESGYAKLTMERVAERADTSRAVIYRRWSNRAELVVAAMRHHQPVLSGAAPDTGTLRGDVLAILRRASARITEIGPGTVIGMLSDLLSDEEAFDQILEQLTRSGSEVMSGVLDRAIARGEARDDIPPRVARLPLDLLRHELILTHQPPSPSTLEEIVDEIFLPLTRHTPWLRTRHPSTHGPTSVISAVVAREPTSAPASNRQLPQQADP
jgi:AcrR family transcriptional regulator